MRNRLWCEPFDEVPIGKRRARNGLDLGAVPLGNGRAQFFRAFAIAFQRARFWKLHPDSGGGLTISRITARSCGLLINRMTASTRVVGGSRRNRTCIAALMTGAHCRWFPMLQWISFLVSTLLCIRIGKSWKRTCANSERS